MVRAVLVDNNSNINIIMVVLVNINIIMDITTREVQANTNIRVKSRDTQGRR